MRKLLSSVFTILMVTALFSGSAWATTRWNFKLERTQVINGAQLKPGSYELRLNGDQGNNEAEIYRNRKLILTAAVEVRPLKDHTPPRSILSNDGVILEIRMKKEVVTFRNVNGGS